MNNYSVPDFEMDDDYALPTSSGFTRPKKSPLAEDEIMELLWQNGQVVMQSQNQRSLKKSHLSNGGGGSGGDAVIPSEQAPVREIRPVDETTTTTQQQVFMQEDEMASWLHYPLDDSSFDYADLLYPPPSAPSATISTTTTAPSREFRTVEIRQPPPPPQQLSTAAVPIAVALRPPPVPPATRRTNGGAAEDPPRFQNFGHFSRLPSRKSTNRIELPGSSKSLKETTVVDSNETPILESKFSNVADNLAAISATNAMTSTGTGAASAVPVTEPTCEHTVTSSPGCSGNSISTSAEPQSQAPSQTTATVPSAADDPKRKGRENDDVDGQNEDAEFESADTKKQARGSASTKRSRAAEVHNLSERRRRDRINEKMKALQELIPRCNKTDKASMLDEAIEYLKSLQLQVQMMSMGCGMVPMMYPGMQQYIPTMGMGLGMGMGMEIGMNRPMVPYPTLLPGAAMQNAAAGPRFPMPPFHLQAVPVPDPSRIQTSTQPDPMLNPLVTLNPNNPRLPNFNDPYQQFFGLQAQVALPQNQAVEQPRNNRPGSSKQVGNPGNHQSG